jgi:hypothetical protein
MKQPGQIQCIECGLWYQENKFEVCFEVTFPPRTGFLGIELESTERLRVDGKGASKRNKKGQSLSSLKCFSDLVATCTVKPHNVVRVKSLTLRPQHYSTR